MTVRVDKRLNLVVPVEQPDGTTVRVFAQPMARDTFERNYLVIARTFAEIYSGGLGITVGPRVAAMVLRDVAEKAGRTDSADAVLNDVRRTSVLIAPGGQVTLQEALDRGVLSEDDASEVENALAFFTVASALHRRAELEPILEGVCALWGAQVTSSTATEFAASLRTPTPAGSTGATIQSAPAGLSSIPS